MSGDGKDLEAFGPSYVPSEGVLKNRPDLAEAVKADIRKARSESTHVAYRRDWRHFEAYCLKESLASFPTTPEILAVYVSNGCRGLKSSTVDRRIAAIRFVHRNKGVVLDTRHPILSDARKGIRRTVTRQRKKLAPMTVDRMQEAVKTLGSDLPGLRDRALLLIGFAGAFRRDEVCRLSVEQLQFLPPIEKVKSRPDAERLVITLGETKTDKEGEGHGVPIEPESDPNMCPVKALREWLSMAKIMDGPVFRGIDRWGNLDRRAIAPTYLWKLVNRVALSLGWGKVRYGAQGYASFGAHSLRSGFITSAVLAGVPERQAGLHARQFDPRTTAGYVRAAEPMRGGISAKVGLSVTKQD